MTDHGSRLLVAAIVAALTAAACSGSSTAPSVNVTGSWSLSGSFTVKDPNNSGTDTCVVSAQVMTLTQNGSAFSGGYTGGQWNCEESPYWGTGAFTAGNGQIIDGQLSGSSVTFAMDTAAEPFVGSITGSTMSGTGTILSAGYEVGPLLNYTGTWTATKN